MKLSENSKEWIRLDTAESTNDFLLNGRDFPSGTVVLAEEQTKGKGRLDRSWLSLRGKGLLFSGLISFRLNELPLEKLRFLPLLCGLSVLKTSQEFLEQNTEENKTILSVKWPNDVYLTRKGKTGKLAGILVETETGDGQNLRGVIGVGMNLTAAPELPDQKIMPVSLYENGDLPQEVFAVTLVRYINLYLRKLSEDNIKEELEEIRRYFFLKGRRISIAGESFVVDGMNDDGGLLLNCPVRDETRILYDTSQEILLDEVSV